MLQLYWKNSFRTQTELRTSYKKSYAVHLYVCIRSKKAHSVDECPPFACFFHHLTKSCEGFDTCQGSMTNCFCFQQGTEGGSTWSSCIMIAGQSTPLIHLNFWTRFHFVLAVPRQGILLPILLISSATSQLSLGTFLQFASFSFSSGLQPGKGKCGHPLWSQAQGIPLLGAALCLFFSQGALSFFLSCFLLSFHLCSLLWFNAENSRGLIPAR